MHDDIKLALAMKNGSTKTAKSLIERFRDELDLALEHCRVAVELGLQFEEYGAGVLDCASKSLLNSMPTTKLDSTLDPHVARILGHRDFALALLLTRQVEDAWRVFVQRFGTYIRSLYIRDGLSYDESQQRLEELVKILSDDSEGPPPIAGYRGGVDLNNWLYCFVRSMQSDDEKGRRVPKAVGKPSAAHSLPLVLNEGELRDHVRREFAVIWGKSSEVDRELLLSVAHGQTPANMSGLSEASQKLAALDPKQLLEKHSALVKNLAHDLRKRVVGHYRGLVSAVVVEEGIIDVITGELVHELQPIVGSLEPVMGPLPVERRDAL